MAHLSCWLAERGMTADDLGPETIGAFAEARRAAGHASQLTGRSLAWMLDYLRGLGAVRLAAPGPAADEGQLLERFRTFLADERGLAPEDAQRSTWTQRAGSCRQPGGPARPARR